MSAEVSSRGTRESVDVHSHCRSPESVGKPSGKTAPTLGEWLAVYINARTDVEPVTQERYWRLARFLMDFFGAKRRIDRITTAQADSFRAWLMGIRMLARSSTHRECKRASQFFAAAARRRLIADNPFARVRRHGYLDLGRFHFVTRERAIAVLRILPNPEWRLIFALCRYGGLRCPSEVLSFRWEHVDWQRNRFAVRTSNHGRAGSAGQSVRQLPIFPELHPYLLAVSKQATAETGYVIVQYRRAKKNLNQYLREILRRAGLEPWPKLFQSLRSTRKAELAEEFPPHVVNAWIGNLHMVTKHYLRVTESDFRRATGRSPSTLGPSGPSLPHAVTSNWAGLPESVKGTILALARTPDRRNT